MNCILNLLTPKKIQDAVRMVCARQPLHPTIFRRLKEYFLQMFSPETAVKFFEAPLHWVDLFCGRTKQKTSAVGFFFGGFFVVSKKNNETAVFLKKQLSSKPFPGEKAFEFSEETGLAMGFPSKNMDLFKVMFYFVPWQMTIKPPFGKRCFDFSKHL